MLSTWKPACWECVGPVSLGRNAGKFKTLLTDPAAVAAAIPHHADASTACQLR